MCFIDGGWWLGVRIALPSLVFYDVLVSVVFLWPSRARRMCSCCDVTDIFTADTKYDCTSSPSCWTTLGYANRHTPLVGFADFMQHSFWAMLLACFIHCFWCFSVWCWTCISLSTHFGHFFFFLLRKTLLREKSTPKSCPHVSLWPPKSLSLPLS